MAKMAKDDVIDADSSWRYFASHKIKEDGFTVRFSVSLITP